VPISDKTKAGDQADSSPNGRYPIAMSGNAKHCKRHKPDAIGSSEIRRILTGGAPARMVRDKSARFQVGWAKRPARGNHGVRHDG